MAERLRGWLEPIGGNLRRVFREQKPEKTRQAEFEPPVEIVPTARVVPLYLGFLPEKSVDYNSFFSGPLFRIVLGQKPAEGPSAEQLVFPGGKLERKEIEREIKKGGGFIVAAVRETLEELGISPVVNEDEDVLGERVYWFLHTGWRGTQERYFIGCLPTLPPIIFHPGAKITSIEFVTGDVLDILRDGGTVGGRRILDSLRTAELRKAALAGKHTYGLVSYERVRIDEENIEATEQIIGGAVESFWESEFQIKARIGEKFLKILQARHKLNGKELERIKKRIFGNRLDELKGRKQARKEKINMLGNIYKRLNGALGWLEKEFDISQEEIKGILYDAYLAVFIEYNLELFREGGQEALGFVKLLEMMEKEGKEVAQSSGRKTAYNRVISLIKEGHVNTEDEVLQAVFGLFASYRALSEVSAEERFIDTGKWKKMGKDWDELFGKRVKFVSALRTAYNFYKYLIDNWKNLIKQQGESVDENILKSLKVKNYSTYPIAALLRDIEKGDIEALRSLVIAGIYAKTNEALEGAGLVQAPLITEIVRKYAEKSGWQEVEYTNLAEEGFGIFYFIGEKDPHSLLRKVMERGILPSKVPFTIGDVYRAAIVMQGVEEEVFISKAGNFINYVVERLKEEGYSVSIDGVDVKGYENQWSKISENVKQKGVKVKGASKVKSSASNPPFKWVKFRIVYSKDDEEGKVEFYSMEFQIFPDTEQFKTKIKDDPRYALDRVHSSGRGRQSLLRMIFPDEVYVKMLPYSSIFTRPD